MSNNYSSVLRNASPTESSDDSAVGSMSSTMTNSIQPSIANNNDNNINHCKNKADEPQQRNYSNYLLQQTKQSRHQPTCLQQLLQEPKNLSKSNDRSRKNNFETINSEDLISAAKEMRRNNVGLISRSVKTHLSCFDELDIKKFETNGDFFVNFVSNGIHKCNPSTILRPVSMLWPDTYDKLVDQLGILDAFLLNTQFHDKPVEWMLKRGLTQVPNCRLCKLKMTLDYQENSVRWHCKKTQACRNYYMPIQRPSFFNGFEKVSLKKLLFAVYFWSTCTPGEDLISQLNIDCKNLNGLWRKIQNVCRAALEKSYPRHRLTDCIEQENNSHNNSTSNDKEKRIPIDLISIKLNRVFIICAKHPNSNLVRIGLHIPNVSTYSFADLTESWFAHGASVRISESKFLNLAKRRSDLKLSLVDRSDIMCKEGKFDRYSAFGYIVTQLTHVFKDYDSSGLPVENLKLMLAELQWRELYGTTPFDSFTNIVNHMASYGETTDWYSEVAAPISGEETFHTGDLQSLKTLDCTQYTWAEKYYYATVEPLDREGNVISRKPDNTDIDNVPPYALVTCHICRRKFECFDFCLHLMHHVEDNRKEYEKTDLLAVNLIECKHCFKIYRRDHIVIHSTLHRTFLHTIKYGCRICCIKLDNRDEYLQHMRRKHFEHETPYRCPSCKYASSFQRDVFLHFSEEHRHNLIVLCALCLRSFTVAKPEEMTDNKMKELSKIIYNHIAEHYLLSRNFTCPNCCLCFLDKDKLDNHMRHHHNPCEVRSNNSQVVLEPFILDRTEERYCVKALPIELFIPNKRPNLTIDRILTPTGRPAKCCECFEGLTVNHFSTTPYYCMPCKYTTLCPKAATAHKNEKHTEDD